MDLSICIAKIDSSVQYRLSSSVPPHEIVEWRGPGNKPSQIELEAAWNEYLLENQSKEEEKAKILNEGATFQMIVNGVIREVVLLEKT